MKRRHHSQTIKRMCAWTLLWSLLFQLLWPIVQEGAATVFAAESADDGSAGSLSYYQQELETYNKGSEQVGPDGALTYRYPMGRVSAVYHSEQGWSMNSHSRITRSSKWGAPAYSDADIFSLDGEELVYAVADTGFPQCPDAHPTRVYHTEHENYTRILYCKPGEADSYWKIFNQDGSWSLYGSTPDSRIEAVGKPAEQPRVWAIAESKDKGEFSVTTYTYTEDNANGGYDLHAIVSGKTGAAANGYSATVLSYETRPDQIVNYRSGARVKPTRRVVQVENVIGCDAQGEEGLLVNGYTITWENSPQTNQSIITAITPYGSDRSTLPPTSFDYTPYKSGFNAASEAWSGDTTAYTLRYTESMDSVPGSGSGSEPLCDITPDGLVACYPFNGNAQDESGNGNNAIEIYADLTIDRFGNSGKAYYFDGADDYIEIPHPGYLTNGTITLWVKAEDGDIEPFYIGADRGGCSNDVAIEGAPGVGGGPIGFGIYGGGWNWISSQILPETDRWYHCVGTWGESGLKIYIDGELKGSNSFTGGVPSRSTHAFIGADTWNSHYQEGIIDDVRIYNRALSETEVQELYEAESGSDTSITEADLLDINGDGLPDRVEKQSSGSLYVRPNTGSAFDQTQVWTLPDEEKLIRFAEGNAVTHDLIDMNGDGQADRVVKDAEGDAISVYLSRTLTTSFDTPGFEQFAETWSGDSDVEAIRMFETNETENITTADLIDMNGDGLPDRVQGDGSGLIVRLNTGSGFAEAASWNLPYPDKSLRYVEIASDGSTNTLHDLIDMNGDGLPDRVSKTADGDLSVYFNTGSGFAGGQTWSGDVSTARVRNSAVTDDNRITEADLMDVNGDGLPDRVSKGSGAYDLDVRLNTGSGFAAPQTWTLPDAKYVRFKDVADTQYDLLDLNGDGVLDRIVKQYAWEDHITVYPGKSLARSDILISSITNSLGGRLEYTYKAIPKGKDHFFNDTNPFYKPKRLVVETVTTDNGLGYRESVSYDYYGGQFDAATREDYGFARVVKINPATDTQTEWHYYQNNADGAYAGRLKKEIARGPESGGQRSIYTYLYYAYDNLAGASPDYGCNISQERPLAGPALHVKSVKLASVDTYLVDGTTWQDFGEYPANGAHKHTRIAYVYNQYGLPTSAIDYGEVLQGGSDTGSDKVETNTEYLIDTTTWQFLPELITTRDNESDSGKTVNQYDQQTGLLTQVDRCKDASSPVSTIFGHDACGNVNRVTDPNGNVTTITYDSRYCAYPEEQRAPDVDGIPFNTVTQYNALMRPWNVWDPNSRKTETLYDAFGRIISITRPGDGADPGIVYTYSDYAPGGGETITPASVRTTLKDGPEQIVHVDGFGVTVQTKVKAPEDTWRTTDAWHYAEDGKRLSASSDVYLTSDASFDRVAAPDQISRAKMYSASFWHDDHGRITETTNFQGETSLSISKHFTAIIVDEERHVGLTELDPANRLKTVTECSGAASDQYPSACPAVYAQTVYYTTFAQETITDAENRVTTRTFNWAGELLTLDDPDLGYWTYSYDDNGNLRTRTDAKEQTVTYSYDAHDRLTLVDYPEGADTVYFYDGDDDSDGEIDRTGMKGQQGYVTDASGSTKWWYDARYRVSKEEKTIGAKSATTEFQYNAYQLTGVKYPGDSGWTSYAFNAAQEITQLTAPGQALVDAVLYNQFGQMTQIDFSSGASQTYSYYPANEGDQGNFRLKNITVNGAQSTLMNRTYTYDKTGNILGIDDTTSLYDQSFEYDALGRLAAQTNPNFVSGAESFSYSLTGNLLSKTGAAYSYHDGTHQVSQVEQDGLSTSYTYDANGNLQATFDDDNNQLAAYTYDLENRLIALDSGAHFEYDYSGRRVQKTENDTITYYFNAYYEKDIPVPTGPFSYLLWTGSGEPPEPEPPAETGVVTTYYYLNGQRVTQKRDGVWTWIHADQLHSATVITNASGQEVRRLAYRAFGEEVQNTGTGDAPPYTYTGKELDGTGLLYYGARYYDPVLSRFITADSIYDAGPQGLNRYSYALNNPIIYNDPTGNLSNPFSWLFQGLHDSPVGQLIGNRMCNEAQGIAQEVQHQITPPEHNTGIAEGSVPIWGDGKDSYLAAKEGKVLWASLYLFMAINDLTDGGMSPEDTLKPGMRAGKNAAEKLTKESGEKAFKKGIGLIDGKFDMALGLARHQETGSPFLLKNFSKHVHAKTYGDIYGTWWPGSMERLEKTIGDALVAAENLHFNLDQFDMDTFKQFTKNPEFAETNITNWELYTILNDPDLLDKTTFYGKGGKVISPPQLD